MTTTFPKELVLAYDSDNYDITHAEMSAAYLADGLKVIMDTQQWIADLNSNGPRIRELGRLDRDQVAVYGFALLDEIHELAKKLGWKTWKTQPEVTPEYLKDIADEFADILAFLGYFVIGLNQMGVTPDLLAEAYKAKTLVNKRTLSGAKLRQDGDGNGAYQDITSL